MNESQSDASIETPLWRNGDFRLLFSAQIISLLGSGVMTVGLALFAYQLTGGASATAVIGNALMLRILAFLLFSQPAGVIADCISRKKILIAADLLRFGLLALFPFITTVWQIYALIFAINAVTAFFTPTFEASIPEVAGNEQYVRALSFSRVAVDIEAVAAPAVFIPKRRSFLSFDKISVCSVFSSPSLTRAIYQRPFRERQSTGSHAPETGTSASCDRSRAVAASSRAGRERVPGLAQR